MSNTTISQQIANKVNCCKVEFNAAMPLVYKAAKDFNKEKEKRPLWPWCQAVTCSPVYPNGGSFTLSLSITESLAEKL